MIDRCPICGLTKEVIPSNNPIVKGVCSDCLNKQLKYDNLQNANFFCKTFNLPFKPDVWMRIATKAKKDTFKHYYTVIKDETPDQFYHATANDDLWSKVDEEWQKIKDFNAVIDKLKTIKEGFLQRMQIKWGPNYSFEEYIKLEDLSTNTIRRGGMTDPLQIDAVKKIAAISVMMDQQLAAGEVKAAGEYAKMHAQLVKSAGLEDVLNGTDEDVIGTISEMCDTLEKNGFQFKFYDGVSRDIVDKTIQDQQEWVRNFVLQSTGIKQTYEMIEDLYKNKKEDQATDLALNDVSLDELMNKYRDGVNSEFDEELSTDQGDDNFLDVVDDDDRH